jgi:hypothetical protein
MKIPTYIVTKTPVSLTHGFTRNFGSVNISMTIQLDRAKRMFGNTESIKNQASLRSISRIMAM